MRVERVFYRDYVFFRYDVAEYMKTLGEAARTFEEQVVTDVREADVGSILGFGFAPFRGGPLHYLESRD